MSEPFGGPKRDFTAEVEAILPEAKSLAESKGVEEAVNLLLTVEKKCRTNNDTKNLKIVCLYMMKICKEKSDWTKLNAVILLIHKRNTQSKSTISGVVTEALTYLGDTPSIEVKIELIKTLKEICEGKIYVEGESAHLHFMLSKIYEGQGNIDDACDIIQDVHVETYGALTKKEKAMYILEQIRLNLLKKDYIRALIASRKMNLKTIEEDGFTEVKIKYYTMMVEYNTVEKNVWEMSQSYNKLASSSEGESQKTALESAIIFLLMSKFDNEQSDMMHRIKLQLTTTYKAVTLDPTYSAALGFFTTSEIIPGPFVGQDKIESHPSLVKFVPTGVDIKKYFLTELKNRVVQHNLRVVAKYYKRIRTSRLCELLGLTHDVMESHLSEVASGFDLYLKIDRPAGIVNFTEKKMPEEVLSEWSSDISKLLNLMESTCHLINRENMVYKA
jgi:26S proteasome regulatory subunit N5